MYPTVCTLMGLWRWVVANGVTWRDATEETQRLLAAVSLSDLQQQNFWPQLTVLVQVVPDGDLLPVRAQYGGDSQRTIGMNYLDKRYATLVHTRGLHCIQIADRQGSHNPEGHSLCTESNPKRLGARSNRWEC